MELMELGLPCPELAGGCCPVPIENCCEEDLVCCDGMCLDAITPEDILNVAVCGDLSCCDDGALLEAFYLMNC
jgi:hypothetical protein